MISSTHRTSWRLPLLLAACHTLTACPDAAEREPTPPTSPPRVDHAPSTQVGTDPKVAEEVPAPPSPNDTQPPASAVTSPADESTDSQAAVHARTIAHPGPWLWIRRSSAGVFDKPTSDRSGKLGYFKRGAKVAILAGKLEAPGCPQGWYTLVGGGVLCSMVGTTDEKDALARFPPRQPNVEEVLPYPYARNAQNGTPLYKSLPSRKQMHEYEPYLPAAKQEREELEKEKASDLAQMREAGLAVGGAASQPGSEQPEIPLWEREEDLHKVTLDDLRRDADDVLAQRMMKGFYVAVDKTFKWNGRTWYKTTKGLVAPADRFWQAAASDFHGVELDGDKWQLPVGFVFGGVKSATTYTLSDTGKQMAAHGSLKKFESVQLSYDYLKLGTTEYYRLAKGEWVRDSQVRVTTPGERPKEVGVRERWVDIDISEQTLVVFEGDRPVYATLLSSGKESKIKDKDHSTPRGMWRVREKHGASTMDGNGSAAGDLPYSIEDVPYIMYFHNSYATHGAFWHQNFGSQMSHGCVNLAPLDAKWLYFNVAPSVPEGMHGVWASEGRPGSMIVIHD